MKRTSQKNGFRLRLKNAVFSFFCCLKTACFRTLQEALLLTERRLFSIFFQIECRGFGSQRGFAELQSLRIFLTDVCLARWQESQAISFNLRLLTAQTHLKGEQHAHHCLVTWSPHQCHLVVDAFWGLLTSCLNICADEKTRFGGFFHGCELSTDISLGWVASMEFAVRMRICRTSHHSGSKRLTSGRANLSSIRKITPWSCVVRMTRPAAWTTF